MKRWFKRLALLTSAVWAFLAVASLFSIYLARGTPDWYVPAPTTPTQQRADANESDQKIADLFSYAGDVAAAQRRRFLTHHATAADIIGPKTLTLTEPQINAFVTKWSAAVGGRPNPIGRYVTGSRVVLLDGSVVIAGTLREMGMLSNSVASIEFKPELDEQGRLWPRLNRIYSGRLPVPAALYAKSQQRFAALLGDDLAEWWLSAGIGPDGLTNLRAAQAAAGRILLASLDNQSAEPLVVLPCAVGNLRMAVPLRIIGLEIAGRRLSATLRPFTDAELVKIIALFRGPFDATTADILLSQR